jgi:hypothetical protein
VVIPGPSFSKPDGAGISVLCGTRAAEGVNMVSGETIMTVIADRVDGRPLSMPRSLTSPHQLPEIAQHRRDSRLSPHAGAASAKSWRVGIKNRLMCQITRVSNRTETVTRRTETGTRLKRGRD